MDACFYEEYIMPGASSEDPKKMDKTKLTLDFSQAGKNTRRQNSATILTSPDLNLLKLGSPELEKLIMSSCGGILTTPTPSQFLKGSLNLSVTEEQERYAHGFVEALEKLHKEQGAPGGSEFQEQRCPYTAAKNTATNGTLPVSSIVPIRSSTTSTDASSSSSSSKDCVPTSSLQTISTETLPLESTRSAQIVIYPTFQSTEQISLPQTGLFGTCVFPSSQVQGRIRAIKLEAVPSEQVVPGTPPPQLPPIDLDLQEAVKNERKKLRNRQAASKCRKRKLERESDLQQKVDDLKEKNCCLQTEAQLLRQQVMDLKQHVMTHVKRGCEIMLSNQPEGL